MGIKTETFTLPAYWASALINGDRSGMSDEDEQEMDAWLAQSETKGCIGCSDEQWFAWRNDANTMGGDVMDYTFAV
jgi:hypothetical protein